MKIIHHDLGCHQKGSVVEVMLTGGSAVVQLMDQVNYEYLLKGRSQNYFGGLVTKPTVRFSIPYTGSWHVVVDPRATGGQAVTSAVRFVTP